MALSLELFTDRDSASLFSGQLISQVCDKMMTLGMVWVISNEKSAASVPWFLAAGALPHLLLSWKAGKWASVFGPLRTLVITDALRGLLYTGAALTWAWIPESRQLSGIFALTVIANSASALFNPAILSIPVQLPRQDLVPKLTAAIDSCFSFSTIAGPVTAAILYPWLGLKGLFLANGLSYFLAALLESKIRLASPATPSDAGTESAPIGALALLQSDSLIRFMLSAFFFMNLVLTPLIALLPLIARQWLGGGIGTLASLETAIGVGTVAGGVVLSITQPPLKTGARAILGLAVISSAYFSLGLSHERWLSCALLGALGFALSIANISLLTLFQTRPAPKDVPVLMSLVNLISVGAMPFSMIIVGGVIEHVPLQLLAMSLAATLGALTLASSFNREFRTL